MYSSERSFNTGIRLGELEEQMVTQEKKGVKYGRDKT
jgi:hypothetical protein